MEAKLDRTHVRRWKRYSAQQPLSLDWPMLIPVHWKVHRLKEVADARPSNVDKKTVAGDLPVLLCNYVDVYKNRTITAEMEFMQATATPSQVEQFSIQADDVIITKDSEAWDDIGVPAHVPLPIAKLVCGYHLTLVRPKPQVLLGAYLSRCFQSEGLRNQFCIAANGVTRYGLGTQEINCFVLPVPPLPEQRAIAAFLDRETARIDALIARKQQLIELLDEKRQAVISHAIKGVSTWPTVRMKFFTDILSGFAFKSEGFSTNTNDIRLLRGINVAPGETDWSEEVRWPREDLASFREYELEVNDLVFAMDRPWISTGIRVARISERDLPCLLLQRVVRLRAKNDLTQGYLELLLNCRQFEAYFEPILTGVSVPHFSPTQLLDFAFRLPSKIEQSRICDDVRSFVDRQERTEIRIRDGIQRLREYRTALISAAVTGQIDVREEVELDG